MFEKMFEAEDMSDPTTRSKMAKEQIIAQLAETMSEDEMVDYLKISKEELKAMLKKAEELNSEEN